MADFTNLLGDTIDNNENIQEDVNIPINYPEQEDNNNNNNNNDDSDQQVVEVDVPRVLEGGAQYGEDEDEGEGEEAEVGDIGVEDPEYKMLKDLWIQEICCPEILPYDHETISMHMDLLEVQEEAIEKLMDNNNSNNENQNNNSNSIVDPILTSFEATIYRMDMERIKFIMEDLQRVRCKKIEEYPLYIPKTPKILERLSEEEEAFLNSYIELISKHYNRTVLDDIKKIAFSKLDDDDMIDTPDLDEYVFCRIKESVVINVPGNDNEDEEDYSPEDYTAGTCLVAKYKLIRDLILEGKVELML